MAIPQFTLRQLVEVGAHFGHTSRRWNPKMKPFIFGIRGGVHIMDLAQTKPMLQRALKAFHDVAAKNGRILFVGTKQQSRPLIRDAAITCGQYYVNHRWLGGTITNWNTIAKSIAHMKSLEKSMEEDASWLTKKELLLINKKHAKLEQTLGGIRDMSGTPDLIFVLDVNIDRIAVLEAVKRKIPVVGVLDSNSIPEGIAYPIPGNDDSVKAISFYLDLIVASILEGLSKSLGIDKMKEQGETPIEISTQRIKHVSHDIVGEFDQNPPKVVEAESTNTLEPTSRSENVVPSDGVSSQPSP